MLQEQKQIPPIVQYAVPTDLDSQPGFSPRPRPGTDPRHPSIMGHRVVRDYKPSSRRSKVTDPRIQSIYSQKAGPGPVTHEPSISALQLQTTRRSVRPMSRSATTGAHTRVQSIGQYALPDIAQQTDQAWNSPTNRPQSTYSQTAAVPNPQGPNRRGLGVTKPQSKVQNSRTVRVESQSQYSVPSDIIQGFSPQKRPNSDPRHTIIGKKERTAPKSSNGRRKHKRKVKHKRVETKQTQRVQSIYDQQAGPAVRSSVAVPKSQTSPSSPLPLKNRVYTVPQPSRTTGTGAQRVQSIYGDQETGFEDQAPVSSNRVQSMLQPVQTEAFSVSGGDKLPKDFSAISGPFSEDKLYPLSQGEFIQAIKKEAAFCENNKVDKKDCMVIEDKKGLKAYFGTDKITVRIVYFFSLFQQITVAATYMAHMRLIGDEIKFCRDNPRRVKKIRLSEYHTR